LGSEFSCVRIAVGFLQPFGQALPQRYDLLSFRPGFSPVTRLALKSRRTVLTVYSSSDLLKAVELERVSGTRSWKPLKRFLRTSASVDHRAKARCEWDTTFEAKHFRGPFPPSL